MLIESYKKQAIPDAPHWRQLKGEPEWVFNRYQSSPWPAFIRRVFTAQDLPPAPRAEFPAGDEPLSRP